MRKYHFVTLQFKPDDIVLLDSQRTSPLSLSLRGGLQFIQREAYQNPDFAAVSLQESGTCSNPVVVDQLPDVEEVENYHCTLQNVWDASSTITEATVISTRHGHVKGRDLRTLKPGNQINDVVINYIGSFFDEPEEECVYCQHLLAEELSPRAKWGN